MVITAPPDEESGILNFCFDRCVAGNDPFLTQNRLITGNELMTPPFFHLCFYPVEGVYVRVEAKYEIFPKDDTSDKTTVTVIYDYNEDSSNSLGNISPENKLTVFQEGKNIKFDYSFNSLIQLEIYNIIGERSVVYNLNSAGLFSLPEELAKGIYICIIKSKDGVLVDRKFTVR
jgi:hypothetical protein